MMEVWFFWLSKYTFLFTIAFGTEHPQWRFFIFCFFLVHICVASTRCRVTWSGQGCWAAKGSVQSWRQTEINDGVHVLRWWYIGPIETYLVLSHMNTTYITRIVYLFIYLFIYLHHMLVEILLLWTDTMTKAILIRMIFNSGWLTGSEVQSIVIMMGSMAVSRLAWCRRNWEFYILFWRQPETVSWATRKKGSSALGGA